LRRLHILLSVLIITGFVGYRQRESDEIKGHLIIIGGGKPPAAVIQKFIDLAGGPKAKIAVIPMASSEPKKSGKSLEEEFLELGVGKAKSYYIQDSFQANADPVLDRLSNASGIYFSGGDQNRLTEIFCDTRCMELFHRMYKDGAVIGGNSAGAAIMSEVMITGEGNWEVLKADSVVTTRGFGFIKRAIIDQHFVARNRFNRLLAVSIQKRKMGIGIDENAAIWVKPGRQVEVLGEGTVLLIDPAEADFPVDTRRHLLGVKGLRLSVLHAGDRFTLE